MKLEEDIVGLTINEALHLAVDTQNPRQVARLIRLQALYYELAAEGLEPTGAEYLARPLREKLGLGRVISQEELYKHQTEEVRKKIRGTILNTRTSPLPQIEDERMKNLAVKVNQQVGKSLEDEVALESLDPTNPHQPPKLWWEFTPMLTKIERGHISRTLYVFTHNGVESVGELRTIEPTIMLGLRGASLKTILFGLTMFDKESTRSNI